MSSNSNLCLQVFTRTACLYASNYFNSLVFYSISVFLPCLPQCFPENSKSTCQPISFSWNTCIFIWNTVSSLGFPHSASGKEPPATAGDVREADSIPGSGRSPGGGHGNPTPVFLPGWSHGQRSPVGYSP